LFSSVTLSQKLTSLISADLKLERIGARFSDFQKQIFDRAVRVLPPGEQDRRSALAGLYAPSDHDLGQAAFAKFNEIKTESVRKAIADKIAEAAAV